VEAAAGRFVPANRIVDAADPQRTAGRRSAKTATETSPLLEIDDDSIPQARAMKPGEIVELSTIAEGSRAGAYVGAKFVAIEGAIPGERVSARILRKVKGGFEAKVVAILERSPDRVTPPCPYFGACGGCHWQHVSYDAQLRWKRGVVAQALDTTGVLETLGCDRPFYYRNKMEFSFGANRWLTEAEIGSGEEFDKGFALGLFAPGRFDRVLDLETCFLQSERSAALVNRVRDVAKVRELPPWNARSHEGYLRHLAIREPRHDASRMVNLVTSRRDSEAIAAFATMLRDEFPEISTFVNTIHSGVAQVSIGEATDVVFGSGKVRDRIGDLRFEIGPQSFFQTNTEQAEKLYARAAEYADLQATDVVFDLFCGVGSIALYVARRVARVVGMELHEGAVENARRNAAWNDIENVVFECGDLTNLLPSAASRHGAPDVVIVDPPRAGIHKKALAALIELRAPRLVYVSCNPKTLASDVKELMRVYRVEAIQPVDLFPQTTHVECVVSLRAR
jgi:23S rRNA (uracil1939-C5)-methyltransferase